MYCETMVVIEAKREKKICSKFIVFEPIMPKEKIKISIIKVVAILDFMWKILEMHIVKQKPYNAI